MSERYVYVIELDPAAVRSRSVNPHGPVIYVGQTGLTPAERFEQHKAGGMYGSDVVRHYGRRLIPELTNGPYPDIPAAEKAERETAARLKLQGYVTFGAR